MSGVVVDVGVGCSEVVVGTSVGPGVVESGVFVVAD